RCGPGSMTETYGDLVGDEPSRIAVQAMRQVAIGGGADPEEFDSECHADARALLFSRYGVRSDAQALITVRKLYRLHDAFCRAYGLSPSQARKQRWRLRTWLGRNLVGLSRTSLRTGNLSQSSTFLAAAALSQLEARTRQVKSAVAR